MKFIHNRRCKWEFRCKSHPNHRIGCMPLSWSGVTSCQSLDAPDQQELPGFAQWCKECKNCKILLVELFPHTLLLHAWKKTWLLQTCAAGDSWRKILTSSLCVQARSFQDVVGKVCSIWGSEVAFTRFRFSENKNEWFPVISMFCSPTWNGFQIFLNPLLSGCWSGIQ